MRQDAATTGSCTTKILSLPITPISAAAIASLLRRRGADAMGMAGRKGMGIACDFSLSVVVNRAVFSFLYLKKNKISKIYVRFEIFQKYTPVALP